MYVRRGEGELGLVRIFRESNEGMDRTEGTRRCIFTLAWFSVDTIYGNMILCGELIYGR